MTPSKSETTCKITAGARSSAVREIEAPKIDVTSANRESYLHLKRLCGGFPPVLVSKSKNSINIVGIGDLYISVV